ncbi:hypothetical protein [Streptomyces bobili]|uniref:hypothetical protein n=1 Tax=Streptomyces bobili TaxID=67280 RepID=UPI0037A995C8
MAVPWDLASRVEARDFALWLTTTKKQPRRRPPDAPAAGSVNPVTGKPVLDENHAAREGWLGEVEGFGGSLAGAEGKLAQIDRRASGSAAIDLGMPRIATAQPTQAEGTASLTQSLDGQQ